MHDETAERVALLRTASGAASQVFTTLLTRSPISRIDVAKLTGLSQAAVTKAVNPLVAAGLVDDRLQAARDGQPGRPASPIAVIPEALLAIGVKVNVDEIIAVATDLRTRVLASERAPLTARDPGTVVDAVAAICARLETSLGDAAGRLVRIGVSVSGDVDAAAGVVRESGIMAWTGVDLGDRLRERLDVPVLIENDVRALTIGEHWFGVGVGTASFAIVTIGRGIGSGLHVNGEVVEGAFGVAGEIGHLPLAAPDRICACGRRGCVEAVAGASAIARAVSEAHGRPVAIDEAARLAHEGDAAATAAFREAAAIIGTAIASLVNLAGPELVIIGGEGVSNFDLFDASLRAAFAEHAFGAAGRCRIVVRPHTFEDWARGAAAAAIRVLVR
ncbi:ROK family transcriptional regulator [Glycomyces harbinensis]|uniref:Sugar kinase of the NBD/HSP70 family, may contain an N-terminal HTH domain n=1 Tax=Glycomyces harbinensis TaxID=58114 RepID=A0A1G7ADE8_9ACTN|nr:ROK family transcriptional regulator [Glycomyces harbinensis]SDE12790.1 Sugar kinase of the NBD/HSP70 family, may contain an N-terminal HTH domain [Glycomyces harbinensis]